MATRNSIESGSCSLNEIEALMKHNDSWAAAMGVRLCWVYRQGIYIGMIKRGKDILFEKEYHNRMLIHALAYMHLDFREKLGSGMMRKA